MRTRLCAVALLLNLTLLTGACNDREEAQAEAVVEEAKEGVQEAAEGTAEAVEDAASSAGDAIQDLSGDARDEVRDTATAVDTVRR
jgi:hypothetical protein